MKRRFKSLLGLLLALSMIISGVSGVRMTAKAAGNYNLDIVTQMGMREHAILPNGESMVFQAFLQEDGISCDDYSIKIESITNTAFPTSTTPANQATAVLGSGNTIIVTANTSGYEGQCKVTVGAYLTGGSAPVATEELYVSILKEFDRLEPLQGVNNPGVGETLDLSQHLVMNHYTYVPNSSQAQVTALPIFANSDYKVNIIDSTNISWNISGHQVVRKMAGDANFVVEVTGTAADGTPFLYASTEYRFAHLNYEVHWDNTSGSFSVPGDGEATFMLDTTNVNNADYSVVFTLGQRDSTGVLSAFPNMSSLYKAETDASGKVTGIKVYGSAVSQVCPNGNFALAAEIFVKGYSVHRCDTIIGIKVPNYSVTLESGSVSATETSRVLALDVTNLQGKTYDIRFTLGQGPVGGGGFTPFGTQTGLFTSVRDNAGKVVGIDLNGEEISKILQGQNFDIKTEVLINQQVVYTTGTSATLVRGNSSSGNVSFNGDMMVSFIDTAKLLPLDVSSLQGVDYDIKFTLGQGPTGNGFTPFGTQNGLFTYAKDSNGKVIGINLNGVEIGKILPGQNQWFDIKIEVFDENDQLLSTGGQSVSLDRKIYAAYFIWNQPGMQAFDEKETAAVLQLDTSGLQNLHNYNYNIAFEIGTFGPGGPSSYTALPSQTGLFTPVIDSNTGLVTGISLNVAAIRQVCTEEQFIVKTDVVVNGVITGTTHFGINFLSESIFYFYDMFGQQLVLPGGANVIPKKLGCIVENPQNPGSRYQEVDVLSVQVQMLSGASDAVKLLDFGSEWNIVTSSLGEAEVTVTHKTVDGGTANYTYTLQVVDSIWNDSCWQVNGVQSNVVPGGNFELELDIQNHRWSAGKGQYRVDTPYEVEWFAVDPVGAQMITVVAHNAQKTNVTLQFAPNIPEKDFFYGYAVYELGADGKRVTDSNGVAVPVIEKEYGRITVMREFPQVYLNGFVSDMEVGETITVTPSAVSVYLQNGVVKEDPITDATFAYWVDPEMSGDDLEVKVNNGIFKVTRLSPWDIGGYGIDVQGTYMGGPWWTTASFYFSGLDYSTSFKQLRGQNETTWMYDNETYTLETDMTNLANKRMPISFEWMVVEWIDEENGIYEDITSGYTVNGNKITLDGKALAAQRLEKIAVAAAVKSNGYMTDCVAYADVEILKVPAGDKVDTTEPVTTVKPVVAQNTVDAAVKEVTTVVDRINEAIAEDEISVDAQGKIDKLPAALEGVVTKETVEEIVKAKKAGEVITVEVVAKPVTKEEASAESAADVAKIEASIPDQGKVAQFLDLSVVIKSVSDDGTERELGTLNRLQQEKMTFAIVLPKNLNAEGRNFYVLRVHDGMVDKLPATKNSDGTISFTTDKYSTYALVYEDATQDNSEEDSSESNAGNNVDDTQQSAAGSVTVSGAATGDNTNMKYLYMLMVGLIGAVVLLATSKKRICR